MDIITDTKMNKESTPINIPSLKKHVWWEMNKKKDQQENEDDRQRQEVETMPSGEESMQLQFELEM